MTSATQSAELLGLLDQVGEEPLTGVIVERVELLALVLEQHLEIRADRGDRRAQLVRGVGDELTLCGDGARQRLARGVEAVEHPVEPARELADLVVRADRDAAFEVVGLGDVVDRFRDARSGAVTRRVTMRASTAASPTPPMQTNRRMSRRRPSSVWIEFSGRAIWTAPSPPVSATVYTRSCTSPAAALRRTVDRRPAAMSRSIASIGIANSAAALTSVRATPSGRKAWT